MKRLRFLSCIAVLGLQAACGACQEQRSFDEPKEGLLDKFFKSEAAHIPVTVANPEMREANNAPTVPAMLRSNESSDIKSPGNVRIDQVLVNEGDSVEANAVLARYSEEDLQLKLAQLRTQLKQAEAVLEKNSYFERNREEMFQDGRMDRTQYDNIETTVEANQAEVDRLRETIEHADERGDQGSITSPFAGIVQSKLAQTGGNYLNDAILFTLTKTDPLTVEFELPAQHLSLFQTGQALNIVFSDLSGERAQATVSSIGGTVNPSTNTFTVKANLTNTGNTYKPGMRAAVELPIIQRQLSFFIPTDAIITDRGQHFVYTVIDGVAHQAIITPKSTLGTLTEVSSGLREDDLIVTKGQEQLAEGTKVDIWGK